MLQVTYEKVKINPNWNIFQDIYLAKSWWGKSTLTVKIFNRQTYQRKNFQLVITHHQMFNSFEASIKM